MSYKKPTFAFPLQGDKYDSSAKSGHTVRMQDRQRLQPVRAHSTYDNLEQGGYGDTRVQVPNTFLLKQTVATLVYAN